MQGRFEYSVIRMYDLDVTQKPDTRSDLLAASREVILERGLASATAREVTGRAHANLASIGYHFGSKDELLAQALVAEVEDLVQPVLAALGSEQEPASRATDAVALLNDLFTTVQQRVPALMAALAMAPHNPAVRTRLADLVDDVRGRLARDIEGQVVAGQLASWVEPFAMASLIVAVVQGVVVSAALDPEPSPGADHQSVAGQFLFLLLAARTPS